MKRIVLISFLTLALVMLFGACAKKEVQVEPVKEPVVEKVEEVKPKVEKPRLTEEEIFMRKSLEELNREGNLTKIHFDFDKYFIRDDMKPILSNNADWLMKHASVEIVIDGHCDERGTVEYNLALGEKRAKSTMEYLSSLGVSAGKIKVNSYGKSKLAVPNASSEDQHQKNRRAEFTVTKK